MKDQLAKLIEAYAAAKASGNLLLLEFAAGLVNDFMAKVDVTEIKKESE